MVLTARQRESIYQKRKDRHEEKGSKLICREISLHVASVVGGTVVAGKYPGEFGHSHNWTVLENGFIIDASADQFGGAPIAVVRPWNVEYSSYLVYDEDAHDEWRRGLSKEEAREVRESGTRLLNPDNWLIPMEKYLYRREDRRDREMSPS